MQPRRGRFLSILIELFASAITLVTLVLVVRPDVESALGSLPHWFNSFLVAFLAARLLALAAIWNLKRWGLYSFFVLECVEPAMGLFVFTGVLTFPLRMLAVPLVFILLAIWILAVRPQWQAFT